MYCACLRKHFIQEVDMEKECVHHKNINKYPHRPKDQLVTTWQPVGNS